MFDKPPKSSPPVLPGLSVESEASLSSVRDAVNTPSGSAGLGTGMKVALDILKNILEGADTLPCVTYVAGIGVKILEIIDEVQTNKEELRSIGLRAKDMIVIVACACKAAEGDISKQLENDLKQLTGTMNDILSFVQELASRTGIKKVLYKMDDSASVKALDRQLTDAFHIFEVQSHISLQITQEKVLREVTRMSADNPSTLVKDCPLRVPEGIYIIRSALDGRVIEAEHTRLATDKRNSHIYVSPSQNGASPYQLWTVFSRSGKEFDYTIRNFATGVVLDVFCGRREDGTQVIGHSPFGAGWQTWAIYGSKRGASYDYCTIRSYGPPTILDTKCVSNPQCDYLHTSRLQRDTPNPSQEWSLIRFRVPTSLPLSPRNATSTNESETDTLHRRRFYLQNVASGGYAAVVGMDDSMDDANVAIEHDVAAATPWYFMHTTKDPSLDPHDDMFALVAGDPPLMGTLDHWGQKYITLSSERFWPSDRHHMWKVIPRDGAFTFKNFASGRLLCQSRVVRSVDTASIKAFNNPMCLWRLIDPSSKETCRVLYDSTLSILPRELSGSFPKPTTIQESTQRLTLRTEPASIELQRKFVNSLEYGHDLVKEMLNSGYTSLTVAPLVIAGWRKGSVSLIKTLDEESSVGMHKFKAVTDFGTCAGSR